MCAPTFRKASSIIAYLVPQSAVTRGKTDTLRVVAEDGTFAPREVKIAGSQKNQWIITGGLKPGEMVMVDTLSQLMGSATRITPVILGADGKPQAQPGQAAPTCQWQTRRQQACRSVIRGIMSRFFIDRPVFAWVVAIFIIFGGLLSLNRLPVEQYPNVSAPQITISVTYPGASAATIEESVLSIIETK